MHVLVADDDVSLRNLVKLALEIKGHDVTAVRNGIEVLDQISRSETVFQFVILDVTMPKLGGFDTERKMRQHEGYAETPVLFLTGDNSVSIDGLSHVQMIRKPFEIKDLFDVVNGVRGGSG